MPPNALPPRATALLLALATALLLFRLGAAPLLGPDEPRYARVAVEMERSGAWVTPTLAGAPWLEKPPLYYWLAGPAFRLLGETEAAARLPSALAGVALAGACALWAARTAGGAAGLAAGFVVATSLLPFVYARAATMDVLLALLVTASTGLLGLRYLGIAGPLAVPAAYAFSALAVLAKGALGLIPGLVALVYLVASRDRRRLRESISIPGLTLFLVIALPWHLLAYVRHGQAFVDTYLLNHNLERFTTTQHHHPGPLWYYVPVILAGFFPWSGLLLPALARLSPRRSALDSWLLVWFLAPSLLLSLAGSKLPGYILPVLPPLAVLIGRTCSEMAADRDVVALRQPAAWLGLALAAMLAAAPLVLARSGEPAWRLAVPTAGWALLTGFAFSRQVVRDAIGALRLLRVGAAGLMALLVLAAPPLLAAHESGRGLFLPAAGREVLAWGAWRTAWMAGYFYNDGRVREVSGLAEIEAGLRDEALLVLCGPAERRRLAATPFQLRVLAEGPRSNALLLVAGPAGAEPATR